MSSSLHPLTETDPSLSQGRSPARRQSPISSSLMDILTPLVQSRNNSASFLTASRTVGTSGIGIAVVVVVVVVVVVLEVVVVVELVGLKATGLKASRLEFLQECVDLVRRQKMRTKIWRWLDISIRVDGGGSTELLLVRPLYIMFFSNEISLDQLVFSMISLLIFLANKVNFQIRLL